MPVKKKVLPLTSREKEIASLANDFHWLCVCYRNEMSMGGTQPSTFLVREGMKLERRKRKLLDTRGLGPSFR